MFLWHPARVVVSLIAVCAIAATSDSVVLASSPKGRAIKKSGPCDGPTDWTLVVRPGDTGKIIVVFSGQGGAANQVWHIFLKDNRVEAPAASRTSGTGGKFRRRWVTKDQGGTDKIDASANNTKTGETCATVARY